MPVFSRPRFNPVPEQPALAVPASKRHYPDRPFQRPSLRKMKTPRNNWVLWIIAACLQCLAGALWAAELQRGNGPEPDSLDPQRAQGLSAQSILRDLFEGLTRENAQGRIEPAAAQSWQISADGLRWTFKLRDNLHYSDGSELTAADFVFALNRALDPKTAAPYAGQLLVIRGAQEKLSGQADALAVRSIDAQTLQIDLLRPSLDLAAKLSLPIAMPVSQRCIAEHGDQCTRAGKLISNGAYRLQDWRPLASVGLSKNPYYWQADTVKISQVRFHVTEDASEEARRFSAGELHLTETVPPGRLVQLRARFGDALQVAPSLGSFYLGFNLTQPPFKDQPALRKALSLAIDRKKITDIITGMGEQPAYRLLPAAMTGEASAVIDQASREQQARDLLKGVQLPENFALELRYNTSLLNRRLMLAVSVMWEQVLGIKTVLRQEEWKVFVQNRRAKRITQVFRMGWNADLADPLDFLETFAVDSSLNSTGFQSDAFNAALQQARIALTPAERQQHALRAEQILLEADAILPLFSYTGKHLVSSKLRGYTATPLDHHPSRLLYFVE
jgi:oligopeptide transport system substrate-binding protein